MEALIVGVVGIVVGTLVAVFGVRVFFALLPAFGFVAGFLLGAEAVGLVLGEGFLATVAGWIAGLLLGFALAILAGLWFWAGIVILSGAIGWAIASGILVALGVSPGLLTFGAGAAGAAVLIVVAIMADAPTIYVAALTSLGGTAAAVAGALLAIGTIGTADLAGGMVAALRSYPVAYVAWLVLAAIAFGYQLLEARARGTDMRRRPDTAEGSR
jgi:hypothetical protein